MVVDIVKFRILRPLADHARLNQTTYNKPRPQQGSPFTAGRKHLLGRACDGMEEIWKPVYGYEGRYEVSSIGNVRSVARISTHSPGVPRALKGKTLSLCKVPGGYWQCRLYKNSKAKHHHAHVLVLEAFVGPRPHGMQACHNDGNPSNSAHENLRWDTPKNNQADRKKHGTRKTGEEWCRAKLTAHEVIEIRESRDTCIEAGRRYGVHPTAIHFIRKRKTWKHLQ